MSEESQFSKSAGLFAEGWLRESLRQESRTDEDFVQRVLAAKSGYFVAQGAKRKTSLVKWVGSLAAAACLALLCLLPSDTTQASTNPGIASIREFQGDVEIQRAQQSLREKARVGAELFRGDRLICRGSGVVIADFSDGSSLDLKGVLKFGDKSSEEDQVSSLESGRVLYSIVEGSDSELTRFETPHSDGEVDAGVFELLVEKGQTLVRTLEGSVRVWNKGAEREWAPVSAGFSATLKPGVSLVARSVDYRDLKPGDVLWSQEFNSHFEEAGSIEGKLSILREEKSLISTIQSIPVEEIHQSPKFRPDEWVSLELLSRQALFTQPEDFEMEIRIRAERPGQIVVAMSPVAPQFRAEHLITEVINVGTEWQRIVLPAKQFKAFEKSRPMASGLKIRSVAVWSWGTGEFAIDRMQVRRAERK